MNILVLGASGATGRHLVKQLVDRGAHVRAVVRSVDRLPSDLRENEHVRVIEDNVLSTTDADLKAHLEGVTRVGICLGHNPTPGGLFGQPRYLVTESTKRVVEALRGKTDARVVLMNTIGTSAPDPADSAAMKKGLRVLWAVLGAILPPVWDNNAAANFLRTQKCGVDYSIVRPDALVNQDQVTAYQPFKLRQPSSSANILNQTSRINVAAFMAELLTDDDVFALWRSQMPVLYDTHTESS